MKKAISLFLALVMMISMSVSTFAAESSEEYYTIHVETVVKLEQVKK